MTRRKRKEANEGGGINENAPSVSNDKANRRGKVEEKSKTVNVGFESGKNTRKSARASLQVETDKPDAHENSDRTGVRRSMRRPASAHDDAPISAPPKKKVRRNADTNSNRSSSKSESQDGDRSDGSEADMKLDNHAVSRRESRNERSRKRKLADINEEPTISAVATTDEKVEKPAQSASDSESELPETKRLPKGSKRRRKFNDSRNVKSSSEETTTVSDKLPKDVEYCHCTVPGYPGEVIAADSSQIDEDWKNWSEYESDVTGDLLCNRSWKSSSNKKSTDSDSCFSILTYNILAESSLKTSHYFKRISPSHWNQKNRHKLLMKELKALNADVLCLQEVEKEYQPELTEDLSILGYDGFFACSETLGKSEGVAIYYRKSRFSDVARKAIPFSQIADPLIDELNLPEDQRRVIREYALEPQMFQCIILKCKDTDKEVCVGNAHISYAKHQKPDLQCVQIARSIDQIMSFSASNREISGATPFIFCGDFNSIPASAAYQLCRDGYLNDNMLNFLQESQNISIQNAGKNKALVNVLWKAFQHSADDLQSCYFEVLNREPPMTLNLESNSGCVDYLWYTKSNLSVDAVLIPRSGIIKRLTDSIPNAVFPSDHISLCARLSFK